MFKLKSLRMEAGLSRAELARALGMNQGTLANYENELRQADYKTLLVLAAYFDVTVDLLLGADEEDFAVANFSPLSAKEKRLISKYRNLNENRKDLLYTLISEMDTD